MNMNEEMNVVNLKQRIIELENIIKKKDIQIAKLKEKLAKCNPFDFIYSPNKEEIDDEEESKVYKDIELIIRYNPSEKPDDKFVFIDYCNFNEKIRNIKKRLFKKISEKYNYVQLKNLKFVYNSYNLNDKLTAAESGLFNKSNIFILEDNKIKEEVKDNEEKIGLTFRAMQGNSNFIFANREIPVGIVLIYYFLITEKLNELIDLINGNNNISFLFNASLLNIKDKRTVGEIFGNIIKNPIIMVNEINGLIGG